MKLSNLELETLRPTLSEHTYKQSVSYYLHLRNNKTETPLSSNETTHTETLQKNSNSTHVYQRNRLQSYK